MTAPRGQSTPLQVSKLELNTTSTQNQQHYRSPGGPTPDGLRSPNIGPVSLEEIPRSPVVYLLLSTEGRDKMIKALQYVLLGAVYSVSETSVVEHAVDSNYWARRLYGNTVTLNNSRRLFRVGSFIEQVLSDKPQGMRRYLALIKSFLEDLSILVRKDFIPFLLSACPQSIRNPWRPVLLLKGILTVLEIRDLSTELRTWAPVIRCKDAKCYNKEACRRKPVTKWELESLKSPAGGPQNTPFASDTTTEPTPPASLGAQNVTLLCRTCGARYRNLREIYEKLDKLDKTRKRRQNVLLFPAMIRSIRGAYWLAGFSKCSFRHRIFKLLELMCELISTCVRLGWENVEPFADVKDGAPLPKQRVVVIICGLLSAILCLTRLYEKGN